MVFSCSSIEKVPGGDGKTLHPIAAVASARGDLGAASDWANKGEHGQELEFEIGIAGALY
jgi:hypothetical protein